MLVTDKQHSETGVAQIIQAKYRSSNKVDEIMLKVNWV